MRDMACASSHRTWPTLTCVGIELYSNSHWSDGTKMAGEDEGACKHDHPSRALAKPPAGGRLDDASAMFRALGDPSRLRLLARLADGEICVTELAELENEKLSTVSARLQTLRAVRLVKRRREAKHIFYGVADEHVLQLVESALRHAAERH